MKLNLNGSSVWARIFLGLGLVALVLVGATVYGSSCSGDVCIQEEIDQLRSEKDAYQSRINELNNNINDLKKGFSAGYVIEQIQTQHLQNVHPDILGYSKSKGFSLVPKAMAASGETMIDVPTKTSADNVSVRFAPDQISVGRYGEVLAELGSPFASVPIEKYCNQAEVKQDMCDILVGISFAESAAGTKFRKKDMVTGQIVVADEEGKTSIFNPVGLKGGGISYPTPQGWYLRPFKSWDDFWSFYPAHMKRAYIDRGGITPASISKCYVGGDCMSIKSGWVNRVESFIAKLN